MIELCSECNSAPVWWQSYNGKCRRCFDKGGHPTKIEADLDAILSYFEGDKIKAQSFLDFIENCNRFGI